MKNKLQWNVYIEDVNSRKIKTFNIFDHGRFYEDVKKSLKKCKSKEEFAEELKHHLMYYYWSKCEWEVVITSWVPHIDKAELDRLNAETEDFNKRHGYYPYCIYINPDVGGKIDVYEQVMMNHDVFVDYVWGFKIK